MSRRLMLLRHAKSDWSDPRLPDHQRPLAARGLRDAPLVGAWMHKHGLPPAKALVSTAARARQTWALVREALGVAGARVEEEYLDTLYAFGSPRPLLQAIRRYGGEADTLLLVGHNEAMHELAVLLAAEGSPEALKRLRKKFPTAALAVIDLPIGDWAAIEETTSGQLLHHVRPKDLRR